jgi:hypothetical protein
VSYGDGYGGGYGGSTRSDGIYVEVDWSKNGDYAGVGENVTARVRGGLSVAYGRDQSTALAPTVSGTGSFTLDNSSRDYSPRNTASPLYGYLKPARPVRITRTVAATDYVLFYGHTDDQPINPQNESGAKWVPLSLVDSLADFGGQTISTPLYAGIRTGQAIGYILDACGQDPALRDLDAGATVIPWFWCDQKDARTALEEIIRSEGPPAMLTIGAGGAIVFRDRHHRLIRSASTTSQSTWRASGTLEPVMQRSSGFYNEAWSNIINTGSASVDVRTPQELQAVWAADTTITLSNNESRLITASTTDPFFNAVPPVAGVDYVLTSGTVTTALTKTSGGSTTIIITAVGGSAVVTGLQLRAQPVTVAYTVQVSASDDDSIDEYGSRSFPGDLPWCSVGDAQAVLTTAVLQRAQPLPILSARFVLGNKTAKAAAILARDMSDRVTVIEPETAVNGDFYVESFAHQMNTLPDHEVTVGLEAVPQEVANVFQLDTAGHGADQGRLSSGMDDPATILILDSAVSGHRLDEGLLAA